MKISWLERLRRDLSETASLPELLDAAVRTFQARVRAQRVEIVIAQGEASVRRYTSAPAAGSTSAAGSSHSTEPAAASSAAAAPPLTFTARGVFLNEVEVRGAGIFHATSFRANSGGGAKNTPARDQNPAPGWLNVNGLASLLLVPLYLRGRVAGYLTAQWASPYHLNQTITEAQALATMVSLESNRFLRTVSVQPSIRRDFERLIDVGQLMVMRTDPFFVVSELVGNTEALLGVPREELMHNPLVWKQLFNEVDLRAIRQKLRTLPLAQELKEEMRLINKRTRESRWMLVRGVALRGEDGSLVGWELYGVDITEKHLAEEERRKEHERLLALLEVSQAVESLAAPELVCSRGVAALAKSSAADAAFAAVTNRDTGRIELVAVSGFAEEEIPALEDALQGRSLVRSVLEKNRSLVVERIPNDTRVMATEVLGRAKLLSVVLSPLRDEAGDAIGALALLSKEVARWTKEEEQVLEAAASLISSALHRSFEISAQRQNTEQYQVLYELNHELARLVTVSEIGAHALKVATNVIPSTHAWFALVTPAGDSLVGQSGLGQRMTNALIDSRIVLADQQSAPLAAWLKARRIKIFSARHDGGESAEFYAALPVLTELSPKMCVVIPLVTLNQVIGLIILEPTIPQRVVESRFGLLQALASEAGMVVFARRLESKMSEADKMRVTGHLAAGVAHNFNNILQGILGYASLLHSQLAKGSTLSESAEQILQAANRGGQLIKQLSGLAQIQGSVRKTIDLGQLLTESKELYTSALGAKISLVCDFSKQLPSVYADESLFQQVMTNLLVNAREALAAREDGTVRVTAETVTVKAGELRQGSRAGRYVRVSVADNGVGMAQDSTERCFEPFYSTKSVDPRSGLSLSGAGLGLSAAYAIVREHDGYLDVRSTVGEGSTFVVMLPALTLNERSSERSPAADGFASSATNKQASVSPESAQPPAAAESSSSAPAKGDKKTGRGPVGYGR